MTLHTVNLLPDHADCRRCIDQLAPGDAVVFLGRGAWIANARTDWHSHWVLEGIALFALSDDLDACGLATQCARSITVVDLPGFVALTEDHERQRAWF